MDLNRVDLAPPGAHVSLVFASAPCGHARIRKEFRALPKGRHYVVLEGEIDALTYAARMADVREDQIKRALRLMVVPPSREMAVEGS